MSVGGDAIGEVYALRFQIEFNFRDATQHVGLADFMNITPTAVHNAANLVNVSATLIADICSCGSKDTSATRAKRIQIPDRPHNFGIWAYPCTAKPPTRCLDWCGYGSKCSMCGCVFTISDCASTNPISHAQHSLGCNLSIVMNPKVVDKETKKLT